MESIIYWMAGILLNAIFGAGICASLDTKDEIFYKWYKNDPTCGFFSFLVLSFWPVMVFFMIRYKLQSNVGFSFNDTDQNDEPSSEKSRNKPDMMVNIFIVLAIIGIIIALIIPELR